MSDTTTRALSLLNLLQTHRHWPGHRARRAAGRDRAHGPARRRAPARARLPHRVVARRRRRLPARGGKRGAAAAAHRRGGRGHGDRPAGRGLPAARRRARDDAHRAREARAGAARSPAPAGQRARGGRAAGAASAPAQRSRPRCSANSRSRAATTSGCGSPTPRHPARSSRRRVEPYALAPADRHWYLLCWDLERDDWRTFRVDRLADVEHTRVLFEPRPLTPEQIEEFILVARSWVRTAVETDVVMDLRSTRCATASGSGGRARRRGRRPHPLARGRRRTSARRCTACPGSRPGVEYTTDLAEPARSELRETLERMLRALDAAPPRPVRAGEPRSRTAKTHSETPGSRFWPSCRASGATWAHRGDPGGPGLRFIPGSVAGSTPAVASTSEGWAKGAGAGN